MERKCNQATEDQVYAGQHDPILGSLQAAVSAPEGGNILTAEWVFYNQIPHNIKLERMNRC